MTDLPPPKPDTSVTLDALNQLRTRVTELEELVESETVSQEARQRALLIAEIKQRMRFRTYALLLGIAVMSLMFFVVLHGMHKIMWGHFVTVPRAYAVALIVAPSVSITTVMVAFLVGAFRRFKEGDGDNISSLVAEGVRQASGGGS